MRGLFSAALLFCSVMDAANAKVLVHGHRGARAMRPENTLPAFEYAIGQGVDALELDLAVTKDNVLVVSHDPLMNPAVCAGPKANVPIHELTLAEVREYDCGAKKNAAFAKQEPVPGTKMPTFEEVLALAPKGRFEFNVETKIFPDKPQLSPSPEDFVALVLAAVRKHHLESRVILQSFDFRTLRAMKKIAPEIRRSALVMATTKSYPEIAREAEATIVSPYYMGVTAEKVKAAHDAGLQVIPWTANDPASWQKLIDAGVDAIITDDPASLIAYLKR